MQPPTIEPGTEPARGAPAPPPVRGLDSAEAARRLARHGANEIRREARTRPIVLFARQFESGLIVLLFAAGVAAALLGEVADAIAIAAIVLLNAGVGFFQDYRAEKALFALRSLTAPRARVLRDGRSAILPAAQVVPGDVLVLEAGDVVPADARLVEAHDLTTLEAALTGESLPVHKRAEPAPPEAPLAERHDAVFLGTSVATGTAFAEVTHTGMQTELGRIAHLLASAGEGPTPLQVRLAAVAHRLVLACLALVVLVAAVGALRGRPWIEVLLSSVSLAVAAVPEGLPAVVTIALALGVQRLAARHVLVRRIAAAETLGSVTLVCTDKTGTLTTGRMAVRELWGPDEHALLFAAAACCDAELDDDGASGTGDPTEIALLAAAAARGIRRDEIEIERPRDDVVPFDSARRYMLVRRADGVSYVKGATEVLVARSSKVPAGALEANARMAARGLRVLAVATGEGSDAQGLELLGLVGIADPPRREAVEAIAAARRAGVRTMMITGDHPVTARAIAEELGLLRPGEDAGDVVRARATAEDKILLVREWRGRGHVVAMTGDGVNDAPALREADVGVAMGRTGTEVTREASDLVLTDDNYASLVEGIREGRGIYENIRKTVVYLLAGNAGELLLMLVAGLAGLPPPLLPIHLLWVNLVTDGLPALALVTDPPASDLLEQPPRPPSEPILGRPEWRVVALAGVVEAAVTVGTWFTASATMPVEEARTLVFTTLVFAELLRSFAARSPRLLFWEVGAFTNLRLLAVVALSAALQLAICHFGPTQRLFALAPLSAAEYAWAVGLALVPVSVLELRKLVMRALARRAGRVAP